MVLWEWRQWRIIPGDYSVQEIQEVEGGFHHRLGRYPYQEATTEPLNWFSMYCFTSAL